MPNVRGYRQRQSIFREHHVGQHAAASESQHSSVRIYLHSVSTDPLAKRKDKVRSLDVGSAAAHDVSVGVLSAAMYALKSCHLVRLHSSNIIRTCWSYGGAALRMSLGTVLERLGYIFCDIKNKFHTHDATRSA
ncbi:hypothetical protein PsorP6_015223 [Peronosclerospora sorghi]|uniref:Uncharacterized protein n=1 Tax=Peronosclerospora sorghi TaxID=230839 RepID=A0ACC0VS98_9STRA|nr:hypothetical protein PsorP6_015223 [Peronosclerospora sorghi]